MGARGPTLRYVGRILTGGQPDLEVLVEVSDADSLALDARGTDNQSHQVFAAVAIEVASASNQR